MLTLLLASLTAASGLCTACSDKDKENAPAPAGPTPAFQMSGYVDFVTTTPAGGAAHPGYGTGQRTLPAKPPWGRKGWPWTSSRVPTIPTLKWTAPSSRPSGWPLRLALPQPPHRPGFHLVCVQRAQQWRPERRRLPLQRHSSRADRQCSPSRPTTPSANW